MSGDASPRTPNFADRVRAAFHAQPFMHTLGGETLGATALVTIMAVRETSVRPVGG